MKRLAIPVAGLGLVVGGLVRAAEYSPPLVGHGGTN